MNENPYVPALKPALSNAAMTARAIAAGLELLRVNRSDDPGLSDDHHEAFCWWLEQSALEVLDVIDMAKYVLGTEPQEEAGHDGVAATSDTSHLTGGDGTARPPPQRSSFLSATVSLVGTSARREPPG